MNAHEQRWQFTEQLWQQLHQSGLVAGDSKYQCHQNWWHKPAASSDCLALSSTGAYLAHKHIFCCVLKQQPAVHYTGRVILALRRWDCVHYAVVEPSKPHTQMQRVQALWIFDPAQATWISLLDQQTFWKTLGVTL